MKAVRCTAESSYTAAKLLAAIAVSSAALCASAATYYWKPGTTQGQWTTIENWSTESATGATASALPGSGDKFDAKCDYNIDLCGETHQLSGMPENNHYDDRVFTISNGILKFSGDARRHTGEVNINSGATLWMLSGSTLYTGVYANKQMQVNVNDGGILKVEGMLRLYYAAYNVQSGGSFILSPSSIKFSATSENVINNNGTLTMQNGLSAGTDTTAGNLKLKQNPGSIMNLGGPIVRNYSEVTFNVDFAGGTVNVTGNASFDVSSAQVSGPVTFNVAEGKTLNTTSLVIGSDGVLKKTGPGYIAFPATAQAVTVSEGGVALDSGTYNLSAVTFAANTTVRIATFGGTINQGGYPASLTENATFTADLFSASAGTTIFNSNDAALLGKIKTDLATSVPQGLELTISGTQLMLETATSEENTFTATGNITEGTGWGGSVPGEGANVAISGEGVVGTLPSGASFPAWSSIEVKNGATLRIEATATLPSITLNKHATLEIGNNATVTLANASDLSGVVNVLGDVITIPGLSIESGATLNVPGGMKFSNVNISLAGTIETTTSGGVTFGYANNGETTYIGFAANGGTIAITEGSGSTYDLDPIEFCCPQSGSSVVAVGDLVLNEANLPKTSGYDYMTGRMVGFHLGRNNSEDMSFNVVFNNTKWGTSGKLYICGGATFSLTNNSSFITYEHHTQWDRYVEISGKGRLYLGEGSEFRLNSIGNYGDRTLVVNPSVSGYNAIVVEHGAIFENYRWTGNNNGVFSVSNGVYRIFEPYIIENEELKSVNTPFDGVQAVNISDDSVLTFTTRNQANGHGYFNNGDDRVVSLADVPITGAGSIALDNANVNKFGVIVTCGSNTATGSASVVAPGEGEGETTLYFADGANWAGTVVSGNVALTNLVDATSAATNTFNILNLAAGTTFPIRVWKTGGAIVAHDGLNVGSYDNNGGKIVLVAMDEELAPGDSFILGTVGDDSKPAVGGKWEARAENGVLKVKYSSGLTVILR